MKRFLIIAALLCLSKIGQAQTINKTPPLWCQNGGVNVLIQGLPSSGTFQATMPSCTVSVFLTGTGTPAVIFSNGSMGPLANPFTANTDGTYGFYASTASNYDIVTTGTIFCIPLLNGCPLNGQQVTTVTLVNVAVQGGGGSGGGGTITGATPNGGLVVTGTTLGLIVSCSNGQTLLWNSGTSSWGCGSGGVGSATPGQLLWNQAGSVAGVCSYDGASTVTCVNLSATNITVTGSLTITGTYQVLNVSNPSVPLACPANGLTDFGVNNDHYLAECIGGAMGSSADLVYIVNQVGQGYPLTTASGTNPGAVESPILVDLQIYGTTDLCASIAAGKTAHLTDGVTLDGRAFGQQGSAIKCGTSTYVAGYQGQVILPGGTINVQQPGEFFMQTRSDMLGQGEDATFIKACVSGNTNCNGVFFPTGATIPTYIVACWTDDGITCNYNSTPTFDTRLSYVTIDCSSNAGTIGLANFVAQENESGPDRVTIHGCGNHGIGYNWGGANLVVSIGAPSQHNSTSTVTPCTNCSLSLPSATLAGDTLPTCGMWGTSAGSPSLTSISGAVLGGNATLAGSVGTDGNFSMQCAYAQGINASPAGAAIAYNFTGNTASYVALMAAEWKNIISLGTLDQVSSPTVVTTANPTCPTITTTKNNEIIICAIEGETAGAAYAVGSSSGCAASACQLAVGTASQGMEYVLQSSAGAITLNWTSATVRRAIVVTMSFVPGTNNGPGSQNHVARGMDVFIGNGETSTSDSVLIWGDTGAIGIAGPKKMENVTATMNPGFTGTAVKECVRISGTALIIDALHLEGCAGSPSYGLALGEDAGFTGISVNNLNSGNMGSATALLFLSNAFASNNLSVTNLNAVGPNFPTDTIIDQINNFTDLSSNESKIVRYDISTNGCRFSGSGSGQCVITTSGFFPNTFGAIDTQFYNTDFNAACQFGDCQGGAASQFPVTFGFTTIPIGWQQIVVSSNGVQGNSSHVMVQDDPGAVAYFGGFPATCNTAQFLDFKVLAKQGPNTAYPSYTPYPVVNVTSSALVTNVVTLTLASTTGFVAGNIIRHAGDTTSALNTLGWITSVTPTTIVYALIGGNTTGTGGTVQIVAGFVVGASAAVSTTAECLSFTIFD